MNRSARKIALLTAPSGPIFRGKFSTLEKQCNFLVANMPRRTDDPTSLTPEVIRRWRREGVIRTKIGDNLHKFCAAVRGLLPLKATADEIASSIVDDDISEYQLANQIGLQKIDADYVLAQYDAGRGSFFPDRTKLYNTSSTGHDKKDLGVYGIYLIERVEDDPRHLGDHKGSIPECVLVIDRYIDRYIENERESLGFIFIKLFVPRLDSSERPAEYSGMLLEVRNYRYFFLENIDDFHDFVTITAGVAEYPVQLLKGIYVSVNIEGDPNPAHRRVTIKRVEHEVTDTLIEKHISEIKWPPRGLGNIQ